MNRGDVRTLSYAEIRQTSGNSDFTDDEMNGLIDRACRFIAPFAEWPRDFKSITPVAGTADYGLTASDLTTDTLKILNVYYGDTSVSGDVVPLFPITQEQLKGIDRNWLDATTTSRGKPKWYFIKDESTVTIHPRPDTDNAASGKALILNRIYSPAAISADSASPELPIPYHDLIPLYVAHLAYEGKLLNKETSKEKFQLLIDKIKLLKPVVEKQAEETLQWGFTENEGMDDYLESSLIP